MGRLKYRYFEKLLNKVTSKRIILYHYISNIKYVEHVNKLNINIYFILFLNLSESFGDDI